MSIRTIEPRMEVDNYSNIQGLDGEGYERSRIADTVGTRVVFNSEWDEYVVMMYIDGHRYGEGDYYTDDKDDARDTAKAIRDKAVSAAPQLGSGNHCDGSPQCGCGRCCAWRLSAIGSHFYCVEPSHGLNCPCVPTR